MKLVRVLLVGGLVLALLGVLVYLLENTRLDVQAEDGSLSFETQLPNAECRKEFTAGFPFVRLECKENEIPPE